MLTLSLAFTMAACGGSKRDEPGARTPSDTQTAAVIASGNTATLSEQQAAKETEIDGLRLLDGVTQEPRLTALDLHLGYVATDTRPGGGRYLCGGMSSDESSAAAGVVADALSRLSDTSLRRLGLRYVILCSRAEASGRRIGGIPVPPLNLLMLDVGAEGPARDEAGLQHLALHELYHLIEFRFNTFQDVEWQSRFGAGYDNSYGDGTQQTAIGSGKRGFLNSYSEAFPHEERAELFASLLLAPTDVGTHISTNSDNVLREKARYVADKSARLLGLRITFSGQ